MEQRSKAYWLALLAVCLLLVVMLAAAQSTPRATPVERQQSPLAVGVIYAGSTQDGGWNQAHAQGFAALMGLPLELLEREHVPDTDSSVLGVVDELAAAGARVIFTTSYSYAAYLPHCAGKYPDIVFYQVEGRECRDNCATYMGRMYQARYLTGIVAGLQTKTGELGYVAAFPVSEVIRGINAFALGARSVNPQAVVHVAYTGSWDNAEAETAAIETLYRLAPIDVLAQHQNTAHPVEEVAARKGGYAIGYNLECSADFPQTFLTAPVFDWGAFYRARIQEYLVGQFQGKHYWEGLETGVVDIAPLSPLVAAGTAQAVEGARRRILAGWDVFYGPIYDQKGLLRVAPGEALADDTLQQEMDWYVLGVQVEG